jgi:hypothetical protein
MQNLQRRSRLARCLVLGLGIAAITVPVAQADVKTLADYPPAIARQAARSYGPLPAAPIKTLADYPPAIAREAAKSYGPLQATSIRVVSRPEGFDWGDAVVDAATVLALVLLGAGVLVGTRHESHQRTARRTPR